MARAVWVDAFDLFAGTVGVICTITCRPCRFSLQPGGGRPAGIRKLLSMSFHRVASWARNLSPIHGLSERSYSRPRPTPIGKLRFTAALSISRMKEYKLVPNDRPSDLLPCGTLRFETLQTTVKVHNLFLRHAGNAISHYADTVSFVRCCCDNFLECRREDVIFLLPGRF